MGKGNISSFMLEHFKHFNAAALVDAAKGYEQHLADDKKMLVSLAGAMSTAELGKSFAEMIRQDKVQIISCTGANLEEDLMNLVAHSHYKRVPNYRDLSPQEEWDLLEKGLNRVTDTCIPEEEAFRRLQKHVFDKWKSAEDQGKRYFPHEYLYQLLLSGELEQYYEIDPKNSWMLAAAEKNLPIVVPGWEDSTLGNIFASYCIKGIKADKNKIKELFGDVEWHIGPRGNKVSQFKVYGKKSSEETALLFDYHGQEELDYTLWTKDCILLFEAKSLSRNEGLDVGWHKMAYPASRFSKINNYTIKPIYFLKWENVIHLFVFPKFQFYNDGIIINDKKNQIPEKTFRIDLDSNLS